MSNSTAGKQAVAYRAVDNVAEALNKLSENGAAIVQPRTNVGGPIHVAIVQDPFGNHIGLIEGA